jgi:hypothetical protein
MSVENVEILGDYIEAAMMPAILKKEMIHGELIFTVRRENLRRFLTYLQRCQLVRARSLGYVRRAFQRPPRPAPHPDRLRF